MINYIYVIFSMILDSIISNYINYQITDISIFTPFFTIISLSIILKYYKKRYDEYLKTLVIFGVVYSYCFVDNILINIFSFFLIGLINIFINKNVINNLLNTCLIGLIDIMFYHCFVFFILKLFNINSYNIWYLVNILRNSIFINILYSIISYKIIMKLYHKISHKNKLSA